jgi:hypothetical protein
MPAWEVVPNSHSRQAPEVVHRVDEGRVESLTNPLHKDESSTSNTSLRDSEIRARASTMFMQVVLDTKDKRHEKDSSRSTVKIMWAAHTRKHEARWSPNEFMTCFFVLIFFFGPQQISLGLSDAGTFIDAVSQIGVDLASLKPWQGEGDYSHDFAPRNGTEALKRLVFQLAAKENATSTGPAFCRFNLRCSALQLSDNATLSWGNAAQHHVNLVTPNALVSNMVYVVGGILLLFVAFYQKKLLQEKLRKCGPCICHSLHDSKHWDNKPMVFEKKIGTRTVCPRHQMIWQLPGHGRMNIMIALAFINEGVFSAAYHICPTSTSLQYDYVGISLLGTSLLLAMYAKRHATPPYASDVCKILVSGLHRYLLACTRSCTPALTLSFCLVLPACR